MYIYTFWSYDSYRDLEIKYLKLEPNVDVHFCLTRSPQCPHVSASAGPSLPHSCGHPLWMTPKALLLKKRHKPL